VGHEVVGRHCGHPGRPFRSCDLAQRAQPSSSTS